MKKYMAMILIAAVLCSLMAGCQPTPKTKIIPQKEELNIESAETEETKNDLAEIPRHIEEPMRELNGVLSVEVNAEVTPPESGKTPVAVLREGSADTERKISMVKYLAQGEKPSYYRMIEEYSKGELEELVIRWKGGFNSDLYAADPQRYLEENKDFIAYLESLCATAGEEPTIEYFDETAPQFDRSIEWDGGKKQKAQMSFSGSDNFMYYNCDQLYPQGNVLELSNDTNGGVTIPEAEARAQAEEFAKGMGFEDFAVDAAGLISYPDKDEKWNEGGSKFSEMPKCYVYYFTRQIGGMTETYVNPYYANGASERYGDVWEPEILEVTVADCGIVSAIKTSSTATVEVLEENAKILRFGEIMERFYESIEQNACFSEKPDVIGRSISIGEIRLGGMRIIEKDTQNYLFVPVWSFFGTVTETYAEGCGDPGQMNEKNQITERDFRQCILTINAIDGSIIDRNQGY